MFRNRSLCDGRFCRERLCHRRFVIRDYFSLEDATDRGITGGVRRGNMGLGIRGRGERGFSLGDLQICRGVVVGRLNGILFSKSGEKFSSPLCDDLVRARKAPRKLMLDAWFGRQVARHWVRRGGELTTQLPSGALMDSRSSLAAVAASSSAKRDRTSRKRSLACSGLSCPRRIFPICRTA